MLNLSLITATEFFWEGERQGLSVGTPTRNLLPLNNFAEDEIAEVFKM